ncbi:MAG: DUF853 family protein [Lachnospiraceae bacterium]|nr:DUF853 family protein [Lachnospiraceae bacterium]
MASNSNMDRQLEAAVGSLFRFIGRMIATFFKGLFRGIRKLNKWGAWIGLGLAVLITIGAVKCKSLVMSIEAPVYVQWLLYIMLLSMPVIYLLILGGGNGQKKYEKIFRDIGFVGKDGKVPYFCGSTTDKKKKAKKILTFKSNIPLTEWKRAKDSLETSMDCTVLKLENGRSKKVVKLTALPSDFKIPELIMWNDSFCSSQEGIITVGQSALENVSFNLNKTPHALIAGETGSGKSVILHTILWQMVMQGSRVYMIDFKGGVEFSKKYDKYGEVVTEREHALEILELLVQENAARLALFRELDVKDLAEYNRKTGQNLCRIGVFTDEVAEMLDKKGVSREEKKIYEALEGKMSTLARLSRATGIHLFLGVQRPDANILPGQIKNNTPVRISGRFADKPASEIVLGNTDAVNLPNIKGRFLYRVGNEIIEFQAFLFEDDKMLHDVDVQVGDMLTVPGGAGAVPASSPVRQMTAKEGKKDKYPIKQPKTKDISQAKTAKSVFSKKKEEPKPAKTIHITSANQSFPLDGSEIEVDESVILEAMQGAKSEVDEFGLNLNFWEEEETEIE